MQNQETITPPMDPAKCEHKKAFSVNAQVGHIPASRIEQGHHLSNMAVHLVITCEECKAQFVPINYRPGQAIYIERWESAFEGDGK